MYYIFFSFIPSWCTSWVLQSRGRKNERKERGRLERGKERREKRGKRKKNWSGRAEKRRGAKERLLKGRKKRREGRRWERVEVEPKGRRKKREWPETLCDGGDRGKQGVKIIIPIASTQTSHKVNQRRWLRAKSIPNRPRWKVNSFFMFWWWLSGDVAGLVSG